MSISWNQPDRQKGLTIENKSHLKAIMHPALTIAKDGIAKQLSGTNIYQILGEETCLISITPAGVILLSSQEEWAGYSIKTWKETKTPIWDLFITHTEDNASRKQAWINWVANDCPKIRIWFQGKEVSQPRIPIEVKLVTQIVTADIDHRSLILLIKNLSDEWLSRQAWRTKVNLYRQKIEETHLDFASWLHDWKNPLGTIESSIWLCLRYNEAHEKEKRIGHLKKMEKAVHEMKIGMQDWQMWHQPPTLRHLQQIPILALIRERIDQLKPLLKPGQVIQVWSQGKKGIYTDPQAITHVLDNLLSNASKYSPDHSTIWVRIWNQKDLLQIDIRDEGIGVPPGEIDRLFEPRFRATNARDLPGNGLGLSTVDRLVKQLGGTIQVTSQQNSGTTISIILKNQHKSYEENSDHRGQSRNPFKHRRDPGAGPVSHANGRERQGRTGNGHSISARPDHQ